MPKAVTIRKVDGKPGQVYYPLQLTTVPTPTPGPNDLLIRLATASLNHRDLFIRQHLYPGTTFNVPLLADGCGHVVATGASTTATPWLHKRVLLNPGTGWASSPDGPESAKGYAILGGTKLHPLGTLQEYVCVDAGEVEEAPGHLSDAEAAALPLTGLTAWRAVVTKGGRHAGEGANVLVTGIGGGVALMALAFARARGARVWVSSGEVGKIERARGELGAEGGVSYREEGWEKRLAEMLPAGRRVLDVVVDGAGGDIVDKGARLLKPGGVIVSYGMTLGPKLPFTMAAVLKNIEIRGSTMGSRAEFKDMIAFVREHQIRPVISRVVRGLENLEAIDGLFEDMKSGKQFGKLVVEIGGGEGSEGGKGGEGGGSKL